jgi:D-alanine-D-alanine ligase
MSVQTSSAGVPARVGVLFGGPSPEHDVSILTGLQAIRGLSGAPGVSEVRSIYWTKQGEWFETPGAVEASDYAAGTPRNAVPLRLGVGSGAGFSARRGRFSGRDELLEIDALLICCHGGPGEDGSLQGLLDLVGIPYTGPTAPGAFVGMDKLAFSALCTSAFLPILPRMPLSEDSGRPDFPPPYIVKPRFGGSSIGIEVVEDFPTALARLGANPHLGQGAVLEPYRPDLYDLQIAVRTWPELELSAIERPLRGSDSAEILGYTDKYVGSEGMTSAPRELPAEIPPELEDQIRRSAREVATLVGARGVARIDFLSDGEGAFVNEVNTIPGSLSRHLFVDPPLSFTRLLLELLEEALALPAAAFSTVGADGTLLRSAGSISRKLA